MKIAIIDSGLYRHEKRLSNARISGIHFFLNSQNCIKSNYEYEDKNGHGTAIASIIHKHYPDAELYIVKIFDNSLIVQEKVLLEALQWSIDCEVDIINMSLGIIHSEPPPNLYRLCEIAYKKNIIICAAANNEIKKKSYPAFFPNVFGIASGASIKKSSDFGYLYKSPVEFLAKGTTQRVAWINNGYKILQGTSYACAHFSGIVATTISESDEYTINGIKQKLIDKNNRNIKPIINIYNQLEYMVTNIDIKQKAIEVFNGNKSIKKVALFPVLEKELLSLYKLRDYANVEIKHCIDFPKANFSVFNDCKIELDKSLPNETALEEVDTLIVGFYLDQLFEANIIFGNELIELAIKKNRNIVYLDRRLSNKIESFKKRYDYTATTVCPLMDKRKVEDLDSFYYLPPIDKPVLGIIGTSSKQGKFTTQIIINDILKKEGYNVGFISTEPHGELLNADFVFPYGYGSGGVEIDLLKWPRNVNNILKGIQEAKNIHIMVSGIQGSIIPRNFNELENTTGVFSSLVYFASLNPDVFVCCINPEDSISDILNAIHVAKTYTGAELLFCAISPFKRIDENGNESYTKLDDFELTNIRNNIVHKLNIPVLNIMDRSNDKTVLQLIEDSLS